MAYGSSTPARTAKPAAASIRGRAAIYIPGLAALALASVALMLAGRNGSNAIGIPSADGAEKVSANGLELNVDNLSLALLNAEKSECVKSFYTIYMTLKGDLDTEMQTFATDKGLDFGAGGGFDRFAQAFGAAADGNSMDDPDYLKVAKAKATLDQVAKYIINKHKADTCAGQTEANKDSNLLYVIPEAQCEKVTDALVTFETNPEGKRLLDSTSGCVAPSSSLMAELTLDKDIATIPAGSAARTTFETAFQGDVSNSLGVPASRILLQNIRAGSVVVEFAVLADSAGTTVDAAAMAAALKGTTIAGSAALSLTTTSSDGITTTSDVSAPPPPPPLTTTTPAPSSSTTTTPAPILDESCWNGCKPNEAGTKKCACPGWCIGAPPGLELHERCTCDLSGQNSGSANPC